MVRGLNSGGGGADFPYTSTPAQQHSKPSLQWLLSLFWTVKWPGHYINHPTSSSVGLDNLVHTATHYKLGSLGIESRWKWDLLHSSRPTLCPTHPPIQQVQCLFPGVKWLRHSAEHQSHLAPRLQKEQRYNSTPPQAFMACFRVNFTLPLPPSCTHTKPES